MSHNEDSFIGYRQKKTDFDHSFDEDYSQSTGIEIPETDTDSSDDEAPIMMRKNKRMVFSDTDSDGEDDRFEKRALSPQTRFSITGVRPSSTSEESEEFENEYEETENEENNATNTSIIKDSNKNIVSTSKNEEPENIGTSNSTKNRFSTFNSSISNKLSSTMTAPNDVLSISSQNSAKSDSVEIVSFQNETIDISSESDTSPNIQSSTPIINLEHETQKGRYKNLIQTKIIPTPSTSHIQRPQFVSPEFLNKEIRQLEDLKSELSTCINLTKVRSNLPDGGSKMLDRIEKLKIQIKSRANMISNLVVDQQIMKKPEVAFLTAPSWDELNAATNAVQSKFTGTKGLATFTAQKALTIDRLKDIHGSLETCPNENILAEDPKGLQVTLMNHQKHALAWMEWREKQKPRGGILADDMGLGKTLTLISLILKSKIENKSTSKEELTDDEPDDQSNNRGWTAKGRKDYHDGGTLVVSPASLLNQWESEVQNRTKRHLLSICVHHGSNRDIKARHLAKYDIVVTTYNIVAREFKTLSTLFGVKWERIILDEAHVIRNHKSQSSLAVCGLKGKYRWALTGTPIQNKEMDLYAILKFLKCSPFDDLQHWKKWIDNKSAGGQQRLNTLIKSLMLRRTKVELQEKGELCLPEKEITLIDVILDKEEMNVYQKIMLFSRTLFAQFLHQRAEKNNDLFYKNQGSRPTFMQGKDPNGAYYKMHQKIVCLHGKTEVKSHQILVLLLRLRQICCHPGLIDTMLDDNDSNISGGDSSKEYSGTDIDLLDQLEKLQINEEHATSNTSLTDSIDNSKDMAMSKASSKVLRKSNPVFDLNRLSSKMAKIVQVLKEKVIKQTSDKAIIVSQWTSVLNLLKTHLSRENISCCSLNGSVNVKFRNDIVTNFNKATTVERVMLLSLTAGGVGLNLVGANHLFLIDLHWNPQLESQAQDRIYRVGQKKNVFIYKFMVKDTIEERIKALQDHKIAIANGVLTGTKSESGSTLTMEDLKSLFGL